MNISLTVESSEWFCLLLPFFIRTPLILMHLYYSLLFLSGEKYMHPKVSNHGTFFPMSQAWVDHSWPLGNEWKPVIGSQIRKGPASTLSISFLKMEKSGENDRLSPAHCFWVVILDVLWCMDCVWGRYGFRNHRNRNVKGKNIPMDGAVPACCSENICWASSLEGCIRRLIRVGLRESGRKGTGKEGKQT